MTHRSAIALACVLLIAVSGCAEVPDSPPAANFIGNASPLIRLWNENEHAFGVFVPTPHAMFDANRGVYPSVVTAAAATELGNNELLDFVFLRLDDGHYDLDAVDELVAGLANVEGTAEPALIVGIQRDDSAVMRAQVEEVLSHGVDGVVIPYINSAAEAAEAVSYFTDIGADVWSPDNPQGRIVAMLMIESGEGLAAAEAIIDTGGYSALGCGVGSLAGELGDIASAEQACNAISGVARSAGLPGMMTAFNADMLQLRVAQGYEWILTVLQDGTDDTLRAGRTASGR